MHEHAWLQYKCKVLTCPDLPATSLTHCPKLRETQKIHVRLSNDEFTLLKAGLLTYLCI